MSDRPAVHVLGAGTILPQRGLGPAGFALTGGSDGVTLFDCGPGSVRALAGAGIALTDVRRVVLSHFHTDHCLDVFALFFARRNPFLGEVGTLELVGPRGTRALVEDGVAALRGHPRDPDLEIVEVEPGPDGRVEHTGGDVRFSAAPTRHTETALCWRADLSDGSSFAFSGDTGEEPSVAELAREVDLFACECALPAESAVPKHLDPHGAGRLAAAARCRRLLLTHFYPEMDPERARREAAEHFRGPIALAVDGAVHELRSDG